MEKETESEKIPQAPTKKLGTRHVQSALLLFMMAIAFGSRAVMSVAIIAMTDKDYENLNFPVYSWSENQKSLILSSLLWGCIVTQIPIGYFTANGGSKKMLCYSFLLGGVASILIPVAANAVSWIGVIACRVVIGMTQGSVTPCAIKLLSQWIPPDERARLGSMVVNGAQLGNVLSMPISGALASSVLGWPSIFYGFGIVSIVWAIAFHFLGADSPSDHPRICPVERDYINGSLGNLEKVDGGSQKLTFPWKKISKSVPVWSLLLVSCGQGFSYYVFLNGLPSYLKYALNYDIKNSGFLSALPYLAMWLMGFPISWLCDFALLKGANLTLVRKVTETIGTWGPATGMLGLCLVKSDNPLVYVMLIVACMAANSATTCSHELNHIDLAPNFSGHLSAIINTMVKVSGLMSPIVVAQFVGDMNDVNLWHIVFYLTASIYYFANLIFILFGTAKTQSWNEDVPKSLFNSNRLNVPRLSNAYTGEFKSMQSMY